MLRDKRNTVARKTRKYTAVVNFFFKLKLSDLSFIHRARFMRCQN